MSKSKKHAEQIAYFEQIKDIDEAIVNMQADANMWRERAASLSNQQEGERVQTSGTSDSMKLLDKALDIEREIDALYMKRKEIIGVIQSLPRPHNNIFYKRYVLGMQFKEISITCHKGESWASTMHGRGLAIVKKILDQMEVTNE